MRIDIREPSRGCFLTIDAIVFGGPLAQRKDMASRRTSCVPGSEKSVTFSRGLRNGRTVNCPERITHDEYRVRPGSSLVGHSVDCEIFFDVGDDGN